MNYDGRNGQLEHYSDTEQNISPLKKNKVLFSDSPWEISDSHRKKELPPLKDTVSIYRKQNPQKQKELFEKWHDSEGNTSNASNNRSFDSGDSNVNLYNKKDSESSQDQTLGYVNNSYMNNNEHINISPLPNQVDEDIIEKCETPEITNKSSRKITFTVSEKDQPDSELSSRPDVVRSSNPTYISNNNNDNNNMEYEDGNNIDQREETGKTDYRKVALDLASQRSSKIQQKDERKSLPDFVLIYNVHDVNALHKKEREIFEAKIKEEDIEIFYDIVGDSMFVQLYPTFERLCQEAEAVALEMPLEGVCF